jgi:hypothetical protein
MRVARIPFCLFGVLVLLLAGCGPAYPVSYEELAKAYESAHKAKDVQAVNKLIYWASMPEKEQKRILDGIANSFEKTFAGAEITGLPDDFAMVRGSYVYPFKPEKELEVSYENPGKKGGVLVGMAFSLGIKDGRAYILYRSEDKGSEDNEEPEKKKEQPAAK